MKPKWLIEHFDDRNSTQLLIEEVKRQGYDYEAIKYEPLQSGSLNAFDDEECVIVQVVVNAVGYLNYSPPRGETK